MRPDPLYPEQRRAQFTLTVGGPALSEELDFTIGELLAFNYSTLPIYLPDVDSYIPGRTYGALIAMPRVPRARALFQAPPSTTPPAPAVAGQVAKLTFFEVP